MIYYECIKIDIGGMQQNEVQVEWGDEVALCTLDEPVDTSRRL
jgi:hypothetical protein